MDEQRFLGVMAAVLDVEIDSLDESSSAESIESWDSLHHMDLIIALEEEFGVRFREADIGTLTSLQSLRSALSVLL